MDYQRVARKKNQNVIEGVLGASAKTETVHQNTRQQKVRERQQ